MKQLQVEILNVTNSFVKTVKGGYNVLEVAYKQDGKVVGKKVLDFATPDTYKVLVNAKAGEVYDVDAEKNEKGYIDWKNVTPAENGVVVGPETTPAATSAAAPSAKPSAVPAARGRVVGNTYETPEERFTNRAAIIRQSTLNMAIELLSSDPTTTLAQIATTARQFEDHVYTDLQARAESLRAVVDGLKG